MKRLLIVIAALLGAGLLVTLPRAWASDRYICTLSSTNPTAVNSSGNAGCKWNGGSPLAVQCDAAAYVSAQKTTGGLATTNDVKIEANQLFDIDMRTAEPYTSVLAVSGTVNCRFYTVAKL